MVIPLPLSLGKTGPDNIYPTLIHRLDHVLAVIIGKRWCPTPHIANKAHRPSGQRTGQCPDCSVINGNFGISDAAPTAASKIINLV